MPKNRKQERWAAPYLGEVVALVTGASYGLGRGIAEVFAECGATVYVTGRTTRKRPDPKRPWTIEETAELVTKSGGVGIAVRCDHRVDAQVERLFAPIGRDHGRLDLLVNNVWAWGGENVDLMRPPGSSRYPSGTRCSEPACGATTHRPGSRSR